MINYFKQLLILFFKPKVIPTPTPVVTPVLVPPTVPTTTSKYLWDTPKNAKHSVRIICDEMGLTLQNKDLICAVIEGESGFYNTAKNLNKNSKGIVTSTDWGICQINDRFHIGPNNDFRSVEYVLSNPDKVVEWMIKMFHAGHLDWWCAYQNDSYKRFLP